MKALTKIQAIARMNELACLNKPFVFLIDYAQKEIYVEEPDAVSPDEWIYNLNGITNEPVFQENDVLPETVQWTPYQQSFEQYERSFRIVQDNMLAGNSYLANLTCKTPVQTNLSLESIYRYSKALYKVWLKNRFVVFSPEIFVRIEDGLIRSFPMKGTIDASLPDAKKRLWDDEKEAAEHATIVDLIRNDLSRVADQVRVERYRYFDELTTNRGTILQTSSEIVGRLPEDYWKHLGELFFSLLPAGSITGAPKRKTVEIIAEAETYERGFYTGIAGFCDGRNVDSGVLIRFVEEEGELFYFKSGGGITCRSDAQSEYEEMKQKVYVPIC